MAQIRIYGDVTKGCIFFDGSTVEPKFLGTILAENKADESDRFILFRTDRQDSEGNNRQIFKRMQSNRVQNSDGIDLVDALGYTTTQVVAYINEQANLSASVNPVVDTSLNGVDVSFKLDATSTSIILSNGYQYGVNTIKAMDTGDGLITIKSIEDARVLFTELSHSNVDINDVDASGGLSDVINTLNELFTVGAFECVIIRDPHSTIVADVNGVDTTGGLVGDAIDPSGSDIGAGISAHYNKSGYKSTETIDQAGEYFTFNMRNEGIFGACLVLDDIADAQGNLTYADPTKFCDGVTNTGNMGIQWGMFFHPSPDGPWTYYGAQTGTIYGSGWNGVDAFRYSNDGANWLAGNAEEFRIGIDANSFISMEYYDNDTSSWVVVSRTNYPVADSVKFHLGIKFCDSTVRLVDNPKVHLLEPAAPTMYFRYIESPDGEFHYPLFATTEEAEYYDEIHNVLTAGTGSSHTHTYVDDASGTTWYMPEASHDAANYTFSSAPSATTFNSVNVTYTEITSLTDADLTPVQFSANDITQEESTNVNLQVTPSGASWSTSVTITPSGSGLVYDGYSLIQGTLTDVGADTTYTVTVTRANSYGSSVGTMTITATDVAPVTTNDTSFTKAIDFSGSSEYLKHNSGNATASKMPLGLSSGTYITKNANPLYTATSSSSRPWAQTIVFKADGNSSLQCIWNNGEGFYSGADNFGLEIDANNTLWFYYGQGSSTSANYNKCYVQIGIDVSKWYGVYIAHKGGRLSGNDATKANLGECFDIRVMSSSDNFVSISPNRSGANSGGNWQVTGRRMDKSVNGMYTIGATAASQKPFYGKVASSVITTLKNNSLAPAEAEIKTMITDPIKWETDYKQGTTFRAADSSSTASVPSVPSVSYQYATQIHLMGDSVGIYPYSNNDAYPDIFNNLRWYTSTKMIMQNMVSNDIETVNINGLT